MVKRRRLSLSRKELGDSGPLGLLLMLLNELVLTSLWQKNVNLLIQGKLIIQLMRLMEQEAVLFMFHEKMTMEKLEHYILLNTKTVYEFKAI